MTEKEIRSKVVEIAKGWLGCKESDGSHKKIIDTYNACKPRSQCVEQSMFHQRLTICIYIIFKMRKLGGTRNENIICS